MNDLAWTGEAWIVPSNFRTFQSDKAFDHLDEIDWSEARSANIEVGDIVYLYQTSPVSALTHVCLVTRRGIPFDQVIDDRIYWIDRQALEDRRTRRWMRLRLRHRFSASERARLTLPNLLVHGLRAAPQGRMRMPAGVRDLVAAVYSVPQASDDASATFAPADESQLSRFRRQIREGRFSVSDRHANAKTRGSAQRAFAEAVKQNYEFRCAVSGISTPEFLVASHIVPWADDASIRLDPANGICLSTLIDRAFDTGFLRITPERIVMIDKERIGRDDALRAALLPWHGRALAEPLDAPPRTDYLRRRAQAGAREEVSAEA